MFLGLVVTGLPADCAAGIIGQWTFEGGSTADSTDNFGPLQLFGTATIVNGELIVSRNPVVPQTPLGWAKTNGTYSGPTISSKTLVSWVTLTNLSNGQDFGSAMTLDAVTTDVFDGIVFGEQQPDRWMNGSNNYSRTQSFSPGYQETSTGTRIQMAYTYGVVGSNVTITGYRDGVQIGQYLSANAASWGLNDAEVIFGARHVSGVTPIGSLDARIAEARLYDTVLTQSEIVSLRPVSALIWNTTTGTWNTTSTVWTTGTGGTLAFTDGDSVTFSGTGGGVVTISGAIQPSSITVSATSGTYTFVSSAGNLLTGTTGLAKSGGGTLILSGSNSFTGTTAVTSGALLVNGVLSSATTTVSGGLLGGSGTVSGGVQLAAGGTIAPGAAPGGTGILTLNSLSGTGGAFAMDITGTGAGQYDRLVIGGNLDYSGNTLQLSLTGTYADGTAWDLFDFTTKSGTLAGISPIVAASAYNGLTWGLASNSTNSFDQKYGPGIWLSSWGSNGQRFIFNQADGVLTVVPEPSTFVMAGAGIVGCALLQWRRARKRAGAAAAKTA